MSTNGAIGFILNGKEHIAYNHSDSYPTWLGERVLKYVRENVNGKTDEIKQKVSKLIPVDEDKKPTAEQFDDLIGYMQDGVGGSDDDWYRLLRGTQGDLEKMLAAKYYIDYESFLACSIHCEWAYIVNLDTQELEIYRGSNRDKNAKGRYAKLDDGDNSRRKKNRIGSYYGVLLLASIPFSQIGALTDDKIKCLTEELEEEAGQIREEQEKKFGK